MGTGYTRNDTSNNIADGNVINASDLDGEFDAIQSAFDASSGHSHDGTSGEGPQIAAGGIANNAVALGTKTTGNYVAAGAVSGVGLSGSASAEGATFTVTSNATNANTANTIVSRDASGNFSAGTVTAALTGDVTGNVSGTSGSTTGNAATATALATGRTIGMTGDVVWTSASFDGSGNVTGTATIQANSVALGTDTTGNYVGTVTGGTGIDSTGATSGEGIAHTLSLDLNELTTSTSDGDGDFFAVVDASGNQKKLTKGNVNISGFNNDSGFVTSADGGNAATLDSLDSTQFLRSDTADTKTSGDLTFSDDVQAVFGDGSDLTIKSDGSNALIQGSGTTYIRGGSLILSANGGSGGFETGIKVQEVSSETSNVELYYDNGKKLETSATGVTVTGTVAATSYTGDGSSLTGISAGATGGGSDQIFYENGQSVTTNYTISNGKNAMSAGPITINNGVTVTVGTGETWTVV